MNIVTVPPPQAPPVQIDRAIETLWAIGKDNWPAAPAYAIIFPMGSGLLPGARRALPLLGNRNMATKQKSTVAKQATKPAQAPVAAPAAPKAVALRGGQAVAQVKLTGKQYRVGADHNKGWWDVISKHATQDKPATVQALAGAGVPLPFIGYTIRRGYLVAA